VFNVRRIDRNYFALSVDFCGADVVYCGRVVFMNCSVLCSFNAACVHCANARLHDYPKNATELQGRSYIHRGLMYAWMKHGSVNKQLNRVDKFCLQSIAAIWINTDVSPNNNTMQQNE
jgi:hypothetical protein